MKSEVFTAIKCSEVSEVILADQTCWRTVNIRRFRYFRSFRGWYDGLFQRFLISLSCVTKMVVRNGRLTLTSVRMDYSRFGFSQMHNLSLFVI
jgi:hypothetical protein